MLGHALPISFQAQEFHERRDTLSGFMVNDKTAGSGSGYHARVDFHYLIFTSWLYLNSLNIPEGSTLFNSQIGLH